MNDRLQTLLATEPGLIDSLMRIRQRDVRQTRNAQWGVACFGADQAVDATHRALRLLEETIEAFQAAGGAAKMAHDLIDYIFARPPGELYQELGGVGLTLLALAHAAGYSADEAEAAEFRRVLSKDHAHFARRNAAKNAAGFNAEKNRGGVSGDGGTAG